MAPCVWGILFAAVGLALSCSLFSGMAVFTLVSGSTGPGLVLLITPLAFLVLLPLFFGIALIAINRLNRRSAANQVAEEPIPPHKM